ncbi:polyphosphate kinase 1 [Bacillus massiliigorillae]|uniref:polyphosphate kinase 1 n=1 Tax=Bacillus massiliigorillae TaxID=1243664 RepID=UPI0003A42C5C|nr:polyphosphate kinase 1 [Bacillus massiliigorillae]
MAKTKKKYDISYTQNRELSWLKFNQRVLEEACDPTVPLYERLKFVSIFESNLDEFFMIRVGSLLDLSLLKGSRIDKKSGMTPTEQLKKIFKEVAPLYKQRDKIFNEIKEQLHEHDIYHMSIKDLDGKDRKFIEQYFKNYIFPVLSPQIVDTLHPFPHLPNKSLNIIVMMANEDKTTYGMIPVPQSLPSVLYLPGNTVRYVMMEKIILEFAHIVFDMFEIVDKTIIAVTRNADISPEDEVFADDDDYRHHMKKILKKRKRLAPVRLEVQNDADPLLLDYLCERLNIKKEQVFKSKAPLCMSYVFSLHERFSMETTREISYPAFEPQQPAAVNKRESMISQVQKKDVVLHYPYETMEPFLRLIKEAAQDENVISIKITIYRLANNSKLVESLIEAAENNKDVTVLMELRARFDEQNNIDWAERLEDAGCTVIYGFEGFKVHSKICLITHLVNNKIQYITQIGTGNYNEKSSKMYTDLSFMTASEAIGNDAANFFKNMAISNLDGQYAHLLVAPNSLKPGLMNLIDEEIMKAQSGYNGRIVMKMNSLTDREMITKLSEASCAGVKINLIIRGICCLVPGIKDRTENITVVSILGRFLEHSRIYCFGEGPGMHMYISSADIMTRNMEKRVEIACPILDSQVKQQIYHILDIQLQDNVKARLLCDNKQYEKRKNLNNQKIDSQSYFMEEALKENKKPVNLEKEQNEIIVVEAQASSVQDETKSTTKYVIPRLKPKRTKKSRLLLAVNASKKK